MKVTGDIRRVPAYNGHACTHTQRKGEPAKVDDVIMFISFHHHKQYMCLLLYQPSAKQIKTERNHLMLYLIYHY